MECDKALENGGFAAAREGVGDMARACDLAIAVRMPIWCWSMTCKAGGKAAKKSSRIAPHMAFRTLPSLGWPVTRKAARTGPRSEASACLSVMNVVTAGPA